MYGRTEEDWQRLEDAGWEFLKEKAAERPGDVAHDPTVSYSDANDELAARTGQPRFDFDQRAGPATMGYLLGRISRNRSWPTARLLISALVRYQDKADAGPGFFSLSPSWSGSNSGCSTYARSRRTTGARCDPGGRPNRRAPDLLHRYVFTR